VAEVQAAMFRRFTRQSVGRGTEVPAPENDNPDVRSACQQLLDMGFQREPVLQALQTTNGNVPDAVILLVSAEEPSGSNLAAVNNNTPAEHFGMDALDAILTETLRTSEDEAAIEQRRLESEEKARLDAALAASLECVDLCASEAMYGSDAVALQGPVQGQPEGDMSPATPPTGVQQIPPRAESKADEARHGLIVRTLDDAELCEKVLGASVRRSHQKESPLHGRPGLQAVSQSEVLQEPDGQQNSLLPEGKQFLPPLVKPQYSKFPSSEPIEEEEKPRRRNTPRGQRRSCKSDELPALSSRSLEATSWPPETADTTSKHVSDDVVELGDIENLRVNGVISSRPHTRDASAKCAATSLPKPIPGTPQTRQTLQMATGPSLMSGSSSLRPPSTPRAGTRGGPRGGPSGSSAFRAAAALSL